MGLRWLLRRKPHSWALSLAPSRVMSILSLFCVASLSKSNSLVIRTPFLLRLLLDLVVTYGSVDYFGVIPLFLKMVEDIIPPKLSIIFCRLTLLGSLPEC